MPALSLKLLLQTSLVAALVVSGGMCVAQTSSPMSSGASSNLGSDQLMQSMIDGMKQMQGMQMSGKVDKDFLTMMKMHHQQAIDMAKVQIDQGSSAEVKTLARKMMTEQKKDLAEIDRLMKKVL